jgi:hypothetical protein
LNYDALQDYVHALKSRRDVYEALQNQGQAERYDQYADAIDFSMRNVRFGTALTPEQAGVYLQDLLHLSAPSEIEARVASHRINAVYAAVMSLAKSMERVRDGKPARSFFIFI